MRELTGKLSVKYTTAMIKFRLQGHQSRLHMCEDTETLQLKYKNTIMQRSLGLRLERA